MIARDVVDYLNADEEPGNPLTKRSDLPGLKVASLWRFR